jgi:hypothetical protein
MSDATLRAFSAEALARYERTGNDHIYGFDLHGKTDLYASDLAKLISDRDALLEALERCLNFIANTESEMGETLECGDKARAAIARAKGGDT